MQPLDGDRLGRFAKLNRCVSQETGQGQVLSCLSVSMGGPKGARSSQTSAVRRIPGFRMWLYVFRCACYFVREGMRDVRRWTACFRGQRIAFTIHEVSGSAVRVRHYPVTVSARAGQGISRPLDATSGKVPKLEEA
jgi:hypothetical protein